MYIQVPVRGHLYLSLYICLGPDIDDGLGNYKGTTVSELIEDILHLTEDTISGE